MIGISVRKNHSFGGSDIIINPLDFNFNGLKDAGVFLYEIQKAIDVLNKRIDYAEVSSELLNVINTGKYQKYIKINIRHFLYYEDNDDDSIMFVFSDSNLDTSIHQSRINVKFFTNSENHLNIELSIRENIKLLSQS